MDDESILVDDGATGETGDNIPFAADTTLSDVNLKLDTIVSNQEALYLEVSSLLEEVRSRNESEIAAYSEEPVYTEYEKNVLDQLTYLNYFCFLFCLAIAFMFVYRFLKIFF